MGLVSDKQRKQPILALRGGSLIWQDAEDLRRLLRCMEANGLVPEPAAVRIVACPPYEYLQTAEHNGRPVGFVPKGTLVCKFICAHSYSSLSECTSIDSSCLSASLCLFCSHSA